MITKTQDDRVTIEMSKREFGRLYAAVYRAAKFSVSAKQTLAVLPSLSELQYMGMTPLEDLTIHYNCPRCKWTGSEKELSKDPVARVEVCPQCGEHKLTEI